MGKVWDITPANDNWERNYAHMEYMRIVIHDLWEAVTYIEVREIK